MILKQLCLAFFMLGSIHSSNGEQQPLVDVLKVLQEEYEAVFSYNTQDIEGVLIYFELRPDESLKEAISRALKNTGLYYQHLGLNFYTIQKIKRKKQHIETGSSRSLDLSYFGRLTEKKPLYRRVYGTITDKEGEGLMGATVLVDGTSIGTVSDTKGRFSLEVPSSTTTLQVSYTGYASQNVTIKNSNELDIQLEEGLNLEAVTVFGNRSVARTKFDSPVPVDNCSAELLRYTGKNTLDEQLNQLVPSFNSGQHPVSDVASHFNPADLRGLLPSRTLVLLNGKRKNSSALLYTYITASRGEVGVDLRSVSADAVNAVQILRDGAAAQYGSDAVAGVINLVLKDKIEPFINLAYSTTGQLDGTQFKTSGGYTVNLGEDGFATMIVDYQQQQRSQRAGNIHSPESEAAHWGTDIFSLSDFQTYLKNNPRAGFQVGIPDMESVNLTLNMAYNLKEKTGTKLYGFGSIMNRTGSSPQFARGPYWVPGFEAIYPGQDYFLPEMAPEIVDNTLTVGLEHNYREWETDLSFSYGRNRIDYFIHNSFNQSLGANSPSNFYNGAHAFQHWVNNMDTRKTFYPSFLKSLTLALGTEQRIENFRSYAGEFASYGDGTPTVLDRIGSESFSGLSPRELVYGSRYNIGAYTEVTTKLNDILEIGNAIRYEYYSDFGDNISWKFNALLKAVKERLHIRTSISSGFRAPALHQIYYTSTTTTLTSEGIVQNRILNNLNPALSVLGVNNLKPETSFNFSTGFTFKPTPLVGLSLDYYCIDVDDRIVLSGQVGMTNDRTSPINNFLESINTASAGFFLNAVNTTTQGLDLVFTINKVPLGNGFIKGSIAANINRTIINQVNLPPFIEDNDLSERIFTREDISRIESWRPQQKLIVTTNYNWRKITKMLSINYYGAVHYKHPTNPLNDATYRGKVLVNWNTTYAFSKKIKWTLGIHNLFNVYPDTFLEAYGRKEPLDANIDFVGRFQYPWQTMQFGIDGFRGFTKLDFSF